MAEKPIVPVAQLAALLDEFGAQALDTVEEQAMLRLMNTLEAKAVELTPVVTGNLEASTVVRVEQRGKRIRGSLRFGTTYAAGVHELPPDARGPRTVRKPGNEFGPAGPKYLERPLRGFQMCMAKDVGALLQEVWAGASRGKRG